MNKRRQWVAGLLAAAVFPKLFGGVAMGRAIDYVNDRRNPVQPDGRIIMIYGTPFDQDRFDATRWFKNGMYRLRPSSSEWPMELGMDRVYVPPIPDSRLEDLRASLIVLLDPEVARLSVENTPLPPPASFKQFLRNPNFDPRPQMLYEYSYFGENQNPCDVYGVYLLIEGMRLCVIIHLDAITGETEFDGIGRSKLTKLHCGEVREDWLFKRLEARQKAGLPPSQDTEFPMAVQAYEPCPKTGLWWTQDNTAEDGRRFTKGERMPRLPTGFDPVWYRLQE